MPTQAEQALAEFLAPLAPNPVFAPLFEPGTKVPAPDWIVEAHRLLDEHRPSGGERAVIAFALQLFGYNVTPRTPWVFVDRAWRERMAKLFQLVVVDGYL